MNIHDARAIYTRHTIEREFLKLLKEKPVSRITVKELCGKCQINRATFYKHYQDIYALMEDMEQTMSDEINSLIGADQGQELNVKGLLTNLLSSTRLVGDSWLVMFGPNGDPALAGKMLQLCYKKALPLIQQTIKNIPLSEQQRLYVFISHGSAGVMLDWITSGMKESPEEIADFLDQTYFTLLKKHASEKHR